MSEDNHSETLANVLKMMDSLDGSLKNAAKEIETIEEIATALLRHTNSAGYGLKHDVKRIDHALAILGKERAVSFLSRELNAYESDEKENSK